MWLPEKFAILDVEYGDEEVAASQGKFAGLLGIAILKVDGDSLTAQRDYRTKPLYEDQLSPKIMGLLGLTPRHFDDAPTPYEPVRETVDLIRNQYVFSWGHIDSIKIRYWATVYDIPFPKFKAVDAYSYLLALDPDTRPRMKDEATRLGISVSSHHEPLADCRTLLQILLARVERDAEMEDDDEDLVL